MPLNQQTVMLPVVDNIISSIQTELSKPANETTPITIATALPPVQQVPVPVFGSVSLPTNNQPVITMPEIKKDLQLNVGDKWGTEGNKLVRNVNVVYTEDGVAKMGVPVTFTIDNGYFTNFYDQRTYVSGMDPEHGGQSLGDLIVKTRDFGTAYNVALVANPTASTTQITASAGGVTKVWNF